MEKPILPDVDLAGMTQWEANICFQRGHFRTMALASLATNKIKAIATQFIPLSFNFGDQNHGTL